MPLWSPQQSPTAVEMATLVVHASKVKYSPHLICFDWKQCRY